MTCYRGDRSGLLNGFVVDNFIVFRPEFDCKVMMLCGVQSIWELLVVWI